ncbi:MAG: hypothetical protein PHI85_09065 [Victivallaceae bacterium]|nr:hypothetical protein [Victivallaceae bacterium]
MKDLIKRIAVRLWPELESKTYFPQLGKVVAIPDPPVNGETCTPDRPRYAVDVRLLTPDLKVDDDMPLLRDVPVAMTGAANCRGFASLPLPGTVVEVAFAYGRQSLPFVRSVLPDGLDLPETDGVSQRWQHSDAVYQEVDATGNWTRTTPGNISDGAGGNITLSASQKILHTALVEWEAKAPKVWVGSEAENLFTVISDFMTSTIAALSVLASHTHAGGASPDQSGAVNSNNQEATAAQARLDLVKK